MTLVFPRDMPEPVRFKTATFQPSYMQLRGVSRGGLNQVVNAGADLWQMSFETPPLAETEAMVWQSFLHSLRGGTRLFKAWHPLRRYAQNYRNGYASLTRASGGSFDGTANLQAISGPRDQITLSTLPAGFVLLPGDMASFAIGTAYRALHRVTEGGTANGSGVLTVTVEPFVSLAAATGVTVDLEKPWCKAVLDDGSVSGPWQLSRRSPVKFQAVQEL